MIASAVAHFEQQQRYAVVAIKAARRAWALGDPASAVRSILLLSSYAARDGVAGVGRMLAEQNIDAPAEAVVNTASVAASTMTFLAAAVSLPNLEMLALKAVTDSGRVAAGVGIATRPDVGWTRMVNTPCCPRCAILAGKFYRWSAGFKRHPRCMCTHIPTREDVVGDVRTDPKALFDGGHVKGLTQAEQKAINDGADFSQVVNSRRSLYVDDAGRRLTREGATRRGGRGVNGVRLAPEQIYRSAGDDRAEALRLLKRFRYID